MRMREATEKLGTLVLGTISKLFLVTKLFTNNRSLLLGTQSEPVEEEDEELNLERKQRFWYVFFRH